MLDALYNESESIIESLKGYQCKRGIKFAEEEIKNPVRILTTTISIHSKKKNRLSVRSSIPAPKDKIREMVMEAKKVKVEPPVKMGDILVENFLNTVVNLVSSETIDN